MICASPFRVRPDAGRWAVLHGDGRHPLTPMIVRRYDGTGSEFSAEGHFKAEFDHHAPLEARRVFRETGWAAAEVEVDEATG